MQSTELSVVGGIEQRSFGKVSKNLLKELKLDEPEQPRMGRGFDARKGVKHFETTRTEYLNKCFGKRFVDYC